MTLLDQSIEGYARKVRNFEQYDFVLNKLPYAIAIFDREMRYLVANNQWLHDYELAEQDLLGRSQFEVFPETPDIWRDIYSRVLAGETIISQDERFQNPKGIIQFLNWRVFPWYEESPTTPAGLVIVTLDTTHSMAVQIKRENILSKSAEERRRRAEILARINSALSLATNEEEILAAVAKYLDQKKPTNIFLSYIEVDEAGTPITAQLVAGWQAGAPLPIDLANPTIFVVKDFAISELWFKSPEEAILIGDYLHDDRLKPTHHDYMLSNNMQALALIPLHSAGKWQGIISAQWQDAQKFTEEELAIYSSLTRTTAAVVASRRAYLREEGIRHVAETIAEINAALAQAVDEQEILNAVAQLAQSHQVTISGLNFIEEDYQYNPTLIETVALQLGDGQAMAPSAILPRTRFSLDDFPINRLILAEPDKLFTIEDSFSDPRTEQGKTREFLRASGIAAYIALPLRSGDRWQGLISFTWAAPQVFTTDLRVIMEAIMPTAASVVASRRAYLALEATRKEAETIAKISTDLAQASTEQEILNAVAILAEPYAVSLSSLSYTHVNEMGQPIAGEVVAIRSGDGNPIPVTAWEVTVFPNDHYPVSGLIYGSKDQLLFIEDAYTDPRLESDHIRQFLKNIHQPAFISMALKIGPNWQGILTFAWTSPQVFNAQLRGILTAIMPTVAAVVASRRLYLQTTDNVKRLREMDTLKNEFLSNMSHELRTPLNAIIGLSDVILAGLDGPISERIEHDVQTIFNAGQQLLSIVNDVLDIAKIEAGVLSLTRGFVDLPLLIRNATATIQVLADEKSLKVNINVPDNLPKVWADKNRVQQIVTNLLMNAVKFTDFGSVEISAYQQGKLAIVCVTDEGIGIKPADHEMIFQQFRQVEGSISRKKGGAGLGLPISKRLVELHGGMMWLESDLGKGAKFYFSLPISVE